MLVLLFHTSIYKEQAAAAACCCFDLASSSLKIRARAFLSKTMVVIYARTPHASGKMCALKARAVSSKLKENTKETGWAGIERLEKSSAGEQGKKESGLPKSQSDRKYTHTHTHRTHVRTDRQTDGSSTQLKRSQSASSHRGERSSWCTYCVHILIFAPTLRCVALRIVLSFLWQLLLASKGISRSDFRQTDTLSTCVCSRL